MKHNGQQGFTLLELLIVISIIALLATLMIIKINSYLEKARDTKRLADLDQVEKALEMYYLDKGYYPKVNAAWSYLSPSGHWVGDLANELEDYINPLPIDPVNKNSYSSYHYDADEDDDFQTYGLLTNLEYAGNNDLVRNDNGCFKGTSAQPGAYYEIGPQVSLCAQRDACPWHGWPKNKVCYGD